MTFSHPSNPQFTDNQVTLLSKASKSFSQLCADAKEALQFVSVNNKIDSVVMDYAQHEKIYQELEVYRELSWREEITRRAAEAEATPEQAIPLREAVGEESYARIIAIDSDEITDKGLFED